MSANTYGRQVVVQLTNKSGGGVIAGDVVIIDTTNNDAFTTTTSAGFTGGVGIAQETIASNATGRVLTQGYAALINVNASVTRGHFGQTYTVAKQATDAGSSRGAGTFCQFLTGGTTPDALVFPVDLGASSGAVATAHGCKVHRASTNVSVGNNTYTAIAFDAEDYDTDSMHDNVTNNTRLTIPSISGVTTGLWAMKAYGYTDVTSGRINCQFRVNGSTIVGWSEQLASAGVIGPFQAAADYVFSAADYVECQVRTVAGAGNAVFDSGASPYFQIAFLGKVT